MQRKKAKNAKNSREIAEAVARKLEGIFVRSYAMTDELTFNVRYQKNLDGGVTILDSFYEEDGKQASALEDL